MWAIKRWTTIWLGWESQPPSFGIPNQFIPQSSMILVKKLYIKWPIVDYFLLNQKMKKILTWPWIVCTIFLYSWSMHTTEFYDFNEEKVIKKTHSEHNLLISKEDALSLSLCIAGSSQQLPYKAANVSWGYLFNNVHNPLLIRSK